MSTWTPGKPVLISEVAASGLGEAAQHILDIAKDRAPVKTGELRDSGSTAVDGNTAAIGFSDSKAIAAHENVHDHLNNGKQAKFLESALVESADDFVKIVAAAVKRAL